MAAKIGVYLCSGCGIGEVLDPAGLLRLLKLTAGLPIRRAFICGQDAGLIQGDVAGGMWTRLLADAREFTSNCLITGRVYRWSGQFEGAGCLVPRPGSEDIKCWRRTPAWAGPVAVLLFLNPSA